MCESLEVCTGVWQAVVCSWSANNERGVVGDEVELVGGAAPLQPPVKAKAPATQTSFQVLSIPLLTQFMLRDLDFTLECSLCYPTPLFPIWASVSPSER